jgi:hypothetical protein
MRPQPHREISPDRLTEIPTDELDYLAGQFHVLTKQMYEELRIRRTAGRTTVQAERLLRENSEDTS